MHAKTVWDVLLASFLIMVGVTFVAMLVPNRESLVWHQRLGCIAASLGFISCGLYIVTVGYSGAGWLMWVALLGWTVFAWPRISEWLRAPSSRRSGRS